MVVSFGIVSGKSRLLDAGSNFVLLVFLSGEEDFGLEDSWTEDEGVGGEEVDPMVVADAASGLGFRMIINIIMTK